jgi:hypothetical protein
VRASRTLPEQWRQCLPWQGIAVRCRPPAAQPRVQAPERPFLGQDSCGQVPTAPSVHLPPTCDTAAARRLRII